MEEILRKLQREASGSKYKAIKESCTWALGKRAEPRAGRAPGTCSRRGRAALALPKGPLGLRGCSPCVGYGCLSRNSESCLGGMMWDRRSLARAWASQLPPI